MSPPNKALARSRFEEIRREAQTRRKAFDEAPEPKIHIGMATCGIASGALATKDAFEQALPYAWRQVELEPWDEPAHRQLMRLLALNNQRSAALTQYETLRDQLAEELSVEPEEETTRLYERIRGGEIRAFHVPH